MIRYWITLGLSSLFFKSITTSSETQSLLIDVEWVIQGRKLGFDGFFMEFLGISSALKTLLPQLRLTKSTYSENMDEVPYENGPTFLKQMFPEERDSLLQLIQKNQTVSIEHNDDDLSYMCNPSQQENNKEYYGGDISRPIVSSTSSPSQCCMSCINVPFCIAWTYYHVDKTCMLKGSASIGRMISKTSLDVTSGTFLRNTETPNGRLPHPRVLIFHGTSCFYQNYTIGSNYKRDIYSIWIGRYMLEKSNFENGLSMEEFNVIQCVLKMDEVWVPSEWGKETFISLAKSLNLPILHNIYVIPEAVDSILFNRNRNHHHNHHSNISILKENIEITENDIITETNKIIKKEYNSSSPFQFLSIFKWEYRKGWDILLTSYWNAFTAQDAVILRLRTHVPSFAHKNSNVTAYIEEFAMQKFGKSLHDLAPVVWECANKYNHNVEDCFLSREQLRDLLSTVDAFVLPTRGEGWGLPIAEAMSMALPVIVTNYSGPTAYATTENSYLIPVLPYPDKLGFIIPNGTALSTLMKQVIADTVSDAEVAARIGYMARVTMQSISPLVVANKMVDRIRKLAALRGWSTLPSQM